MSIYQWTRCPYCHKLVEFKRTGLDDYNETVGAPTRTCAHCGKDFRTGKKQWTAMTRFERGWAYAQAGCSAVYGALIAAVVVGMGLAWLTESEWIAIGGAAICAALAFRFVVRDFREIVAASVAVTSGPVHAGDVVTSNMPSSDSKKAASSTRQQVIAHCWKCGRDERLVVVADEAERECKCGGVMTFRGDNASPMRESEDASARGEAHLSERILSQFASTLEYPDALTSLIDEDDLQYSRDELVAAIEFEIQKELHSRRHRKGIANTDRINALERIHLHAMRDVHRILPEHKSLYRLARKGRPGGLRALHTAAANDSDLRDLFRKILTIELFYRPNDRA